MNDLQQRKVSEHNDLISSVAKMDKVPLKIFELAVSCIDTENPPKDHIIYLSKQEMFAFFDVSDNDKHSRFKQAVEKMQKQAYFSIREKTDKGFEFESIVPIPTVKWSNYNDEFFIRFNPDIMPYLIDLKANFTQYAISDIMELNSKYSIILYKWLSMKFNQGEKYDNDKLRNPSIKVSDLRQLTDTLDEYKHISNFFRRVIDEPIKEINECTHFIVSYEKIKKGRTIDSIQFHIKKKFVAPNTNYKEEQQDLAYLKDVKQQEERQNKLFAEAMSSKYTQLLLKNLFIGQNELTDIKIMAGLQEQVYPIYEEIENIKTNEKIPPIQEHMDHIRRHRKDYGKKNYVKYFKTTAEDGLRKLKVKYGVKRIEEEEEFDDYLKKVEETERFFNGNSH